MVDSFPPKITLQQLTFLKYVARICIGALTVLIFKRYSSCSNMYTWLSSCGKLTTWQNVFVCWSFSSPHLLPMELLKSASITLGVVFVLISGITMMLVLSATNWDTLLMVSEGCLMCFTSMLFYIMYRCSRIFYCLLLLISYQTQHHWFKLYW